MTCQERNTNDGNEDCCLHDLLDGDKNAPGKVCCWCGDIYQPDYEPTVEHGIYKPSPHYNIHVDPKSGRKSKRFRGILR
jgi:hypothetical protein